MKKVKKETTRFAIVLTTVIIHFVALGLKGQESLLIAEKMPEFKMDGYESIGDFLGKNLRMPNETLDGKVYVQFTVGINGKVTEAKVVRGLSETADKEVLRVVKLLQYTPGMQNGKVVSVTFTLPVSLKNTTTVNTKDEQVNTNGVGCISGDCENAYGTKVYTDKSKYQGYFKGGLKNGIGMFIENNGEVYNGEWVNNQKQGKGKLIKKDGTVITGSFVSGKISGNVEIKFKDGRTYKGTVENEMPNGIGITNMKSGLIYEGKHINGIFSGEGKLKSSNNQLIYTGNWENGLWCGNGTFWVEGKKFEGIWSVDNVEGVQIYCLITRPFEAVNCPGSGRPIITFMNKYVCNYFSEIDCNGSDGLESLYYHAVTKKFPYCENYGVFIRYSKPQNDISAKCVD
jgi:TonB family protein